MAGRAELFGRHGADGAGVYRYFLEWRRERSIEDVTEVTRPVLERYQRSLYQFRKKDGAPLTFRTPTSRLLENRLPKYVLSVDEIEAILRQPDVGTVEGLRDRAILEVFYSTGMRRMEVANLKVYDLDPERGAVTIRLGKGKKDRYIPMSERAFRWIGKYVAEARPALLMASDDGTIFPEHGAAFERLRLTTLVRGYIGKSKIGKTADAICSGIRWRR
jgi:integrase/recombinase XerD